MPYQDHCQTAADVRRAARDVVLRRHLRERALAEKHGAKLEFSADLPHVPPKPLEKLPNEELLALIVPARQRILELLKRPDVRHHRLAEVMTEVCNGFAINVREIVGDRQDRRASVPRNISYLLCQMLTLASSTRIGQAHGGRDHSTVLTQIKKLRWLREKLNADLTSEAPISAWVHAAIRHLNSRWEERG